MKVYLLQDDLYESTLSIHATAEAAESALEEHLAGEATEQAKRWWESFGADSEFAKKYPPKESTLEDHLAKELACARRNLRIQEWEVKR